jgi:glycyl-tRNA synthetase (class II)
MIVKNEVKVDPRERFPEGGDNVKTSHEMTMDFQMFIDNHVKIRNHDTHHQLQEDLVEHLWQHHADKY